jgi:hypothetical protein
MNANEDLEVTTRQLKKLLQLENYLKQAEYAKTSDDGLIFRELWYVNLKPEIEDEFYSPREVTSGEFEGISGKKKGKDPMMELKEEQKDE